MTEDGERVGKINHTLLSLYPLYLGVKVRVRVKRDDCDAVDKSPVKPSTTTVTLPGKIG